MRTFLDGFSALLDQTHHGLARLRLRLLSEKVKDPSESFNMRLRLLEMLDERLLKFWVVGRVSHLRKRTYQLRLCVEQIL